MTLADSSSGVKVSVHKGRKDVLYIAVGGYEFELRDYGVTNEWGSHDWNTGPTGPVAAASLQSGDWFLTLYDAPAGNALFSYTIEASDATEPPAYGWLPSN